ncbi:MAG: MerR family DNA-binding transcriptional regulator [Candidatus Neomarinimicrobiota bacterium]
MSKENLYTVPQLSKELDITERAIRFYESKGLVKPSRVGKTRVFNYKDRTRLLIILRAKKLGFSLKDIKTYLDLYEVDPSQKIQSKNALEAISHRLFQLEDQKKEINFIIKELKFLKNDIVDKLENS